MKIRAEERIAFEKAIKYKFDGTDEKGILSTARYNIFKEECIKLKLPVPTVNKYIALAEKYKKKEVFK